MGGPDARGAVPGPDRTLAGASAMVFVDDPAAPVLSDEDAHHLLDVLRLRAGEVVVACDGAGAWTTCRLARGDGGRGLRGADPGSLLVVEGAVTTDAAGRPAVTVGFAPTKGDRPEWVVQKLTELGVDTIVPLLTDRSVVRWEGERGRRSVARLRRVAREAAAQCRRTHLPEVTEVTPLAGLADLTAGDCCLAQPGGSPPSLARPVIAVGPEGGWTDHELGRFGHSVGLGPTVLRAETAAVTAGALLCGLRGGVVEPLA